MNPPYPWGWDRIQPRNRYACPWCGRRFRNVNSICRGDVWTADGRRHDPIQPRRMPATTDPPA